MDKLDMKTENIAQGNIEKIRQLFPNAVTEVIKDGKVELAIDFDVLKQELSESLIDEGKERYQMTWPGKRQAVVLANTSTTDTLRPCKEESVDFDNTQNLYIEGDNLNVLKLLRETYLGKIKMIYIDPPYNTGNDFIYNDDFAMESGEWRTESGNFDEQGNRLVKNLESNGRFHTDWLNMLYPRLRLARDLLTDDGVIFISIDDNEQANLKKICDEVFGADNFRNTILVRRRIKSLNSQFADNGLYSMNVGFEFVLVYSKSNLFLMKALRMKKEQASTQGRWDVFWSNADRPTMRYEILGFTPTSGQWRNSREKAEIAVANYEKYVENFSRRMSLEEYYQQTGISDFIRRIPNGTGKNGGVQHWVPPSDTALRTSNWIDIEVSQIGKEIDLPFSNPKNKALVVELMKLVDNKDCIILDFFSGSATTAHAVMQLNAEDGGSRKFIMVQLPEKCDEKSEAYKAGYKNICEIGKERIRRAGKKIKEENGLTAQNLDTGFRVLKLDSSNMQDVYYNPAAITQTLLETTIDNIKSDRTPLDLLFQVMLELGVPLSAKIEENAVNGKTYYAVNGNDMIACFDDAIDEEVITAIAKQQPLYAVFKDKSFASDSVAINNEQLFKTYSPATNIKVV